MHYWYLYVFLALRIVLFQISECDNLENYISNIGFAFTDAKIDLFTFWFNFTKKSYTKSKLYLGRTVKASSVDSALGAQDTRPICRTYDLPVQSLLLLTSNLNNSLSNQVIREGRVNCILN